MFKRLASGLVMKHCDACLEYHIEERASPRYELVCTTHVYF